ncbi:MAG: cytochrome P450 [Pseudomonadota bacterium]
MHIDLTDPATFAAGHPRELYRHLQDEAPCYWHEEAEGPGFWVLTRYDDVAEIGRRSDLYSSEPTVMLDDPELSEMPAQDAHKMMLMMDPPQHTQFRRIIAKSFTKGPAAQLAPRARELSKQIVDRVIERGECDFVADIAGELPSYFIAELMGLPLDDGRELYKLTEIIHTARDALPPGAQAQAIGQMFGYASEVYRRKLETPADDLASQIVHAELDGERLDEQDFQLFFMLLIDAGGDTTRNLLAGGLNEMIGSPDTLHAFRAADTAARGIAREELLRVVSPVIYFRRTALADHERHGQTIKAGDKVVRYFAAANIDPRRFEDPLRMDLARGDNAQIAFGTGTHVCLGQHIARVEIDAMFDEIMARMADFKLLEPPSWLASNFISGIQRMPLGFRQQ